MDFRWRAIGALLLLLIVAAPSNVTGRGRGGVRHSHSGASSFTFPWRFAYVTDTHIGWPTGGLTPRTWYQFGHAVDSMNAAGIDFMILGGDYAEDILNSGGYGDEAADSLEACQARSRFQWWPVLGNHETSDTTLYEPAYLSILRFPGYFSSRRPYYSKSWKNLDFVSIANVTDYDVLTPATDYRLNNPFGMGAEVPGYDFYGIASTTGTERTFMRSALAARSKTRWLVVAQHRPNVGSDANSPNRYSWNSGPGLHGPLRGTGYVKEIEDSLKAGERGILLMGDQHLPLWFTRAIADSAFASATGKGLYHIMVSGSGAARKADSTQTFSGAWLQAALFLDPDGTANLNGHTSTGWADTLTSSASSTYHRQWTWQLYTVWGDRITVETFMVQIASQSTIVGYTGAGHSRLIDRRDIRRDLR